MVLGYDVRVFVTLIGPSQGLSLEERLSKECAPVKIFGQSYSGGSKNAMGMLA